MNEIFKSGQTKLTHLRSFGSSWGLLADGRALAFVDNHDNQRGHGGGGNVVTYKSPSVSISASSPTTPASSPTTPASSPTTPASSRLLATTPTASLQEC